MTSYAADHPVSDDTLAYARMLVEGGYAVELGIDMERLFPDGRPTSQAEIDALTRLDYDELPDKDDNCAICLSEFAKDETILEMPCKHFFHSKCIITWLKKVNSCPSCRHKLPDKLEEEYRRQEKRKVERAADLEELHNSMYG